MLEGDDGDDGVTMVFDGHRHPKPSIEWGFSRGGDDGDDGFSIIRLKNISHIGV